MKLISLSDFVLEKNEFGLFKRNDAQIRKYADFLQQELKLSMFIPCDEDEKPIHVPDKWLLNVYNGDTSWALTSDEMYRCRIYNEGLGRVLFDGVSKFEDSGFEYTIFYGVGYTQVFDLSNKAKHIHWRYDTIESLLAAKDDTISVKMEF